MLRGLLVAALLLPLYSQSPLRRDPSPHTVRFVTVEKNVQLEVLDWGGSGRPMVLLAGGGDTAHVFDDFAPKLTATFHVYGITRRGFGASGFAQPKNAVDRLRDDVLAVLDALKVERPVLVGHSIGGSELSSVASSHPERIAGLVYLEAAYPYAYYDGTGPTMKDIAEAGGLQFPDPGPSDLVSFNALEKWDERVFGFRKPEGEMRQSWVTGPDGRPTTYRKNPGGPMLMAVLADLRRYTITAPALAIFALPHVPEKWIRDSKDPAVHKAGAEYFSRIDALTERQTRVFAAGVASAHVVRLAGAHYIFLSNESDVLREMRGFLAELK